LGVLDEKHERVLQMHYQGKPFGDHLAQFKDNDHLNPVLAKEFGEAVSFAHLAVAANFDDQVVNVENRLPPDPDLLVELRGGQQVYVEIARVVAGPSARYHNTILAMNTELRHREHDDPKYMALVTGKQVTFVLPDVPPSSQARRAVDEIQAVMASIDFSTVQHGTTFHKVLPAEAPTLAALKARYMVSNKDGVATYVRVTSDAHAFSPDDSVGDFLDVLKDKMTKNYGSASPIWLMLVLEDLIQVPMISIEAIRGLLPAQIGQFGRLFVGTIQEVVVVP